jgi:hypothetical protein
MHTRRQSLRWRGALGRPTALITILVVALIVPPHSAAQEGFDEFSAGEWFGSARAGGYTTSRQEGGTIRGYGEYAVTMEFLVPLSGPTTGSWTLEGWSAFTVRVEGVTATIEWSNQSAEGQMTGDRQRLALGTTRIRSSGEASSSGFRQPIQSTDPLGPIDLRVAGRLCDDAWGEWIMSWNTMLEGQGYSPTFDGQWHAVRQTDEFSASRMREIAGKVFEVNNRVSDLLEQASRIGTVSILPWDVVWGLISEVVELLNELRNLSLCDRALLGDRLETYINVLTMDLGALVGNYLLQLDLEDLRLNGQDLLELATLLASVGAIGEGSHYPQAEDLEGLMETHLDEVLDDPDADEDELTAAIAAAEQMGWEFAGEGSSE